MNSNFYECMKNRETDVKVDNGAKGINFAVGWPLFRPV